MRAETVKKAFYRSIPVLAGYVVLGIGFGILLRNAGYGALCVVGLQIWKRNSPISILSGTVVYMLFTQLVF